MPSLSNHQSNDFTIAPEDIVSYFNKPVFVNEDGCWIWGGEIDKRGYARHGGTLVYGFVWRMAGFECLVGSELCHICTNRSCINPKHLYKGTHKQNMEDAALAGVMGQGPRKVTAEQITMIHQMLVEGYTQRAICKAIGVSEAWFTKFKNGGLKYAKLIQSSVK